MCRLSKVAVQKISIKWSEDFTVLERFPTNGSELSKIVRLSTVEESQALGCRHPQIVKCTEQL